ncbi:hypothetical protein AGMMS49525_00850 [Bacteroidia bacterium]|nr:hypothetical protein AGMMS49525_00850 [Bacteroidia bacterium]
MKNLDLNAYGVSEMSQQEMKDVEGGSIFGKIVDWVEDAAEWVEDAAETAWNWCKEHVSFGGVYVPGTSGNK